MNVATRSRRPGGGDCVLGCFAVHAVEGLVALLVDDSHEMDDGVASREGFRERGGVEYVSLDGLDRPVVSVACLAGIPRQDPHHVTALEQPVHDVRAHETRAARHEDSQSHLRVGFLYHGPPPGFLRSARYG